MCASSCRFRPIGLLQLQKYFQNYRAARYFVCWSAEKKRAIHTCIDKRRSAVRLKGTEAAETKQEISQILDRHRKKCEDAQHIKATKGTKAYLTFIGSKQNVCYPLYWNKEDCEGHPDPVRVQLSRHDPLYHQILKMVNDTWDGTKVGIGFDGAGLSHTKIVVKQIYVCKNVPLLRQYDATRKNMCMDASVNHYTPVNGLQGEREIATRAQMTGKLHRVGGCRAVIVFTTHNFFQHITQLYNNCTFAALFRKSFSTPHK